MKPVNKQNGRPGEIDHPGLEKSARRVPVARTGGKSRTKRGTAFKTRNEKAERALPFQRREGENKETQQKGVPEEQKGHQTEWRNGHPPKAKGDKYKAKVGVTTGKEGCKR